MSLLPHELIVDNFAGGGGTSTGLEQAFARPVDIAINHDSKALAMHRINHPDTKHYCESVWDVDPCKATGNQPVGLVWLSPDCKHFSKAKGSKPVEKKIRGLAWVALRWASKARPRVIMLENVEEFKTWGDLDKDGNSISEPLRTIPTRDRFGLVTVDKQEYQIVDIGFRMLQPVELFKAQGFPESYIFTHGMDENGLKIPLTKTEQTRMVGNSVCPQLSRALVEANFKHENFYKGAA